MTKTLSQDEINSLAINFICGNVRKICRLCFASIESKQVCLEDVITVSTSYGDENVSFTTMFSELGVSSETYLPQILCQNCALITIKCYVFFKLYQFSTEKWNNIIDIINKNLNDSSVQKHDVKSIYLVINKSENIMFQTRSKCTEKNEKSAMLKFRGILKRHRSFKKKETTLNVPCTICKETFSNLALLMKHMKEHNKFSHPCTQCPKIFATAFLLKEHNERIHKPKLLKCSECSEKCSTQRQLKLHIGLFHVEVTCKICHLKFKSRKELRPHMERHSSLECEKCNKKLKNSQCFLRHKKICERGYLQFKCDICNKVYSQKNTLRVHIMTDHNFGEAFSCQWCNKKFTTISKLKGHEVKHTKEKKFQCDICGGKFVTKPALLYHTRLHTGETPYPCEICGQSFLSASRRMAHAKRKHIGPQEECHHCKIKFTTKYQLREHLKKHSNPGSKLYMF